ncbi:MAG: hypothetical protein QM489_03810 [Candidatus Izemoplasma sp.]
MKKIKGLIYLLVIVSIGYLFYNYIFTDFGYGMMSHNSRYYNNYTVYSHNSNWGLVVIACAVLVISVIVLIFKHTEPKNEPRLILDQRLSNGEISIEEYQNLKKIVNK